MGRETQRRIALLGIVGSVAVGWVAALQGTSVSTPVANAASSPRVSVARVTHVTHVTHIAACPFPAALRSAFEAAARDASIPPAMLYAVAKVESNLRLDAHSTAGARGLLQLMPATAQSLALNIDEPNSNVLAGARYLRQMIDRFGSSDLALAAYNAGPTAVTVAGGAPTIDVERYVANVDALWHSVAGCR
jgi:soluble lytic murein transglycosylase-like protein